MAIRVGEEIKGQVAVLTVSGARLMSGPDVVELHEHIKRLVKDGVTQVVVDLSSVTWAGSSLLGILVAGLTTLRNAEGDLRICGISGKMRSLFLATELNRLFHNFESQEEAVGSFEP